MFSVHDSYPQVSDWEIAVINNCRIDEVEEALALLPTLKAKTEKGPNGEDPVLDYEQIENLLTELKRYQST